MEPVRESLLVSTPILIGAGLVLVALIVMVLRRRSMVVHGGLDGPGTPAPKLLEAVDGAEPPTAFERIEKELQAGRLINAIKLYREETGAGLKEAKDAVERMRAALAGLPSRPELRTDTVNLDRVQQEIAAGRLINAIKLYREATGVGLKEAKEAVERMQASPMPVPPERGSLDASLESELSALLAGGRIIEAVKLTRERLNLSLKEAKDYVDDVQRRRGGARS